MSVRSKLGAIPFDDGMVSAERRQEASEYMYDCSDNGFPVRNMLTNLSRFCPYEGHHITREHFASGCTCAYVHAQNMWGTVFSGGGVSYIFAPLRASRRLLVRAGTTITNMGCSIY